MKITTSAIFLNSIFETTPLDLNTKPIFTEENRPITTSASQDSSIITETDFTSSWKLFSLSTYFSSVDLQGSTQTPTKIKLTSTADSFNSTFDYKEGSTFEDTTEKTTPENSIKWFYVSFGFIGLIFIVFGLLVLVCFLKIKRQARILALLNNSVSDIEMTSISSSHSSLIYTGPPRLLLVENTDV